MIIRSQDKRKIINIDNIDSICTDYGNIKAYNGLIDSCILIGEYSKRDKAIKVLDMICDHYQYLQECRYIGMGINQPEFIFQLPQDCEVEE